MSKLLNHRSSLDSTEQTVTGNLNIARTQYAASKDSTALTAGALYMVWLDTCSEQASADLRKWFNDEVDRLNQEIETYNKDNKALRERAMNYVAGTLGKDDMAMLPVTNDADRAEQEAEQKKLREIAKISDSDWSKRRWVRLEQPNEATGPLTVLVRYTLQLYFAADASIVSRYAKVLEWVKEKAKADPINTAADIASLIKDAGGFERVLNAQRGNSAGNDTDQDDDDTDVVKAITGLYRTTITTAAPIGTFPSAANSTDGTVVALIGRIADGKVEVVCQRPMTDEDDNRTFGLFDGVMPFTSSDRTEVVWHVARLAELVGQGEATSIREAGLNSGLKLPSERVLTLATDDNARLQLVASARYADASVVVKATPTADLFEQVAAPQMLGNSSFAALYKRLGTRVRRSLFSVEQSIGSDNTVWYLKSNATANGGEFTFESIASIEHKPLEVSQFRQTASAVIDDVMVKTLLAQVFPDGAPSTKAAGNPVELRFDANHLAISGKGKVISTLNTPVTTREVALLSIRSADFFALLKALSDLEVGSLTLAIDIGGLLKAFWTDDRATYEVYVPTVLSDGKLCPRRVEPMIGSLPIMAAA